MIVAGAIVPHAPVLTDALARDNAVTVAPIRRALGRLDFAVPEIVLVLSPHGRSTGVYARAEGSLGDFGARDSSTKALVDDDLAHELAVAWGVPLLQGDLDHGALVPLRLLDQIDVPVVCASLKESITIEAALRAAEEFSTAANSIDRPLGYVASAHLSAGLTERAPLGPIPEAESVDRSVLELLVSGSGDRAAILTRLDDVGGSCGAGPLAAFTSIFKGIPATVSSYEHPFGVGYLVAHALR